MRVSLDVAGMYFSFDAHVAEGACVKDVLDDVAVRTRAPGYSGPRFRYSNETIGDFLSIDGVRIDHVHNSAKSRQKPMDGKPHRIYPDGIYRYNDDAVDFDENGRLKGLDNSKDYVLSWQYYVYSKEGVEAGRFDGSHRRIVSYAEKRPTEMGYRLEEGSTVVLRLIAIFYQPVNRNKP